MKTGNKKAPESILMKAHNAVNGDRNQTYGNPSDNFADIAAFWNVFLEHKLSAPITPLDVAHMNGLQKYARLKNTPDHMDTIVDVAGYAATAERVLNGN